MELADLYERIEGDLLYVEQHLSARLQCSDERLQQAATHLLRAGGKRLRPVFVLLAGMLGHYDLDRLGKVAVALELIHMATLVHDDVIDHADTRRGRSTVKSRYGNQMAMVAGDFIFAQALDELSGIEQPDVHRILSRAIWRMVAGEIEQIQDLFSLDQSLLQYLRRIRRKTALLIEMSCTLGGLATTADPQVVLLLRRYGYATGMAFQITDDILDFTATTERLGKPVGGDLRQGNLTAPTLFALQDKRLGTAIRALIGPKQTPEQVIEAISLVKQTDGIVRAQRMADQYLEKAQFAVTQLPQGMARDALESLAGFVGHRDY